MKRLIQRVHPDTFLLYVFSIGRGTLELIPETVVELSQCDIGAAQVIDVP